MRMDYSSIIYGALAGDAIGEPDRFGCAGGLAGGHADIPVQNGI